MFVGHLLAHFVPDRCPSRFGLFGLLPKMSPDTSFSLPDLSKKRYDFCRAPLANRDPPGRAARACMAESQPGSVLSSGHLGCSRAFHSACDTLRNAKTRYGNRDYAARCHCPKLGTLTFQPCAIGQIGQTGYTGGSVGRAPPSCVVRQHAKPCRWRSFDGGSSVCCRGRVQTHRSSWSSRRSIDGGGDDPWGRS